MKRISRWRPCTCQIRRSSTLVGRSTVATTSKLVHSSHDPYNAFTSIFEAESAKASTSGPLSNLRISIKDNFATLGAPTSCASKALASYNSPFEATVISLLRSNGAELVGKTNMDEFGMGSHGLHSYYGEVRNPLDSTRVAGGSSSGAAASVAAGLCDAAIGSDTGGSIRLPASYTGTIGFKPSYGLLSRYGLVAYASSLDTVGIIARKVANVRSIFRLLDQYDDKDPTAIQPTYRNRSKGKAAMGIRIGIPAECFPKELSQASIEPLRRTLKLLREKMDARIISVSVPSINRSLSAYYTIATAEASSNLARYDGVRYGYRSEGTYTQTRSEAFGEEVEKRIILGTYALTADAFDNYFLAAQRLRTDLKNDMDAIFRHHNPLRQEYDVDTEEGVDVLLFPSAISPAPTISEARASSSGTDSYVQDVLTVPASLAGLPAMSYPVGSAVSEAGSLPVGVQIVGQWGQDELVMEVAEALESFQA